MPHAEIEQTIADVNVRAHTFRFITPAEGERLKIPNGCQGCHADKGAAWATEQLRGWKTVSPWRVAERDMRVPPGGSASVDSK